MVRVEGVGVFDTLLLTNNEFDDSTPLNNVSVPITYVKSYPTNPTSVPPPHLIHPSTTEGEGERKLTTKPWKTEVSVLHKD